MHACMNCSKGSSSSAISLEIIIKVRLNFSLLKNFETKMADLGSDLFILVSVYPKREKDGMGRPYQYQKMRIKPC